MSTTVDEVMEAAAARWQADGWHRFDDHEANCTVQLFRWIQHATRTSRELAIVSPLLEWVQPTPAMLAGTASAQTMARPDLRLMIGSERGLTIECKRLSAHAPLPTLYVNEGMKRFSDGKYAAEGGEGRLVAYVQRNAVDQTVDAVNAVIEADTSMGPREALVRSATELRAIPELYDSEHVRGSDRVIRLRHYLLLLDRSNGGSAPSTS